MEQEALDRELAALNAARPEELEYFCEDCRIVALNELVRYSIYGRNASCADFEQLNALARQIAELTGDQAEAYRAVITLRKPDDTNDALEILQELGEYDFRQEILRPS